MPAPLEFAAPRDGLSECTHRIHARLSRGPLTFMALSPNVAYYEQLAKQFTAQYPTVQVRVLDSEVLDLASQADNTPEGLFERWSRTPTSFSSIAWRRRC